MVFGVDVLELDFWVQVDSIEQPIKRNSVSWKHVSLWDFLPLMIILITASLSSNTYNKASRCEDWTFEGNTINVIRHVGHSSRFLILVTDNGYPWSLWSLNSLSKYTRTEIIRSHKLRAGIPSNLSRASREMISDSVELCETEVCFLHIQLIGTNV